MGVESHVTPKTHAVSYVESCVRRWSKKYDANIKHVDTNAETEILEGIFSLPSKEEPVPICVVKVLFKLKGKDVSYSFENMTVEHKAPNGNASKFEMWLDRCVKNKLAVRGCSNLSTPFEESRNKADAYNRATAAKESQSRASPIAEKKIPVVAIAPAEDASIPLSQLLANIFDAADEGNQKTLTHKEVRDLLFSTPLGLDEWDVLLLLTSAVEDEETGLIEYRPFLQSAPKTIEDLSARRKQYTARKQACLVSQEAVELCFGVEIEEACRGAKEVLLKTCQEGDKKEDGVLHRTLYRQCLLQKPERFTLQECNMLMQMLAEDESGMIKADDLAPQMVKLRIQGLHNALVESDVAALRMHLITLLRKEGLERDNSIPIWFLRNALLRADQLCLSRMQVHVLLCAVTPNGFGWVDVDYALRVLCTAIPQFFDAQKFMENATQTAKEQQAAQELAELKELQGFQGKAMDAHDDAGEADDQPDRETVEKALILAGNLNMSDVARSTGIMEVAQFLQAMLHETVSNAGLKDYEVRGFIAEANLDSEGSLHYASHVHLWVPIIFELRKSQLYESFLNEDWSATSPNLADLSSYEKQFPLQPDAPAGRRTLGVGDRRDSKRASLRGSFVEGRSGSKLMQKIRKSPGFVEMVKARRASDGGPCGQAKEANRRLSSQESGVKSPTVRVRIA